MVAIQMSADDSKPASWDETRPFQTRPPTKVAGGVRCQARTGTTVAQVPEPRLESVNQEPGPPWPS